MNLFALDGAIVVVASLDEAFSTHLPYRFGRHEVFVPDPFNLEIPASGLRPKSRWLDGATKEQSARLCERYRVVVSDVRNAIDGCGVSGWAHSGPPVGGHASDRPSLFIATVSAYRRLASSERARL